MNIVLHIERLVLEGVPLSERDGARLQQSLGAELTRVLGERGLATGLAQGGAVASLPAASVVSAAPAPDAIGRHVGAAVSQQLTSEAV